VAPCIRTHPTLPPTRSQNQPLHHRAQLEPEHTLQLQPGERVLSVKWQNLASEAPLEPSRTAGALLTTRRLLLVAGDLRVLAEVATAAGGAGGVPHAVTSFVWAGPALLYMTAGGQVGCLCMCRVWVRCAVGI